MATGPAPVIAASSQRGNDRMMKDGGFDEVVRGKPDLHPARRRHDGGALPYVEHLLSTWGRWARRQVAGGIGFPSCSPMFKDMPVGKSYGSRPPLGVGGDDCEATDRAVRRLSPENRRLCVEVYQVGGKTVEIAARLGWHRQRVPERLQRMHQELLGHLNDIAARC